jgi:hypothetical protein
MAPTPRAGAERTYEFDPWGRRPGRQPQRLAVVRAVQIGFASGSHRGWSPISGWENCFLLRCKWHSLKTEKEEKEEELEELAELAEHCDLRHLRVGVLTVLA